MSNNKTIITSGGISFTSLLFIVFLVLKLGVGNTVIINWSWWWVTCPLWLPAAVGISIFLIVILFLIVFVIIASIFNL